MASITRALLKIVNPLESLFFNVKGEPKTSPLKSLFFNVKGEPKIFSKTDKTLRYTKKFLLKKPVFLIFT